MQKCCFFIGHREAEMSLQPQVERAIERLIDEEGVKWFVVGHRGGFDRVAHAALAAVKKRRPDITLTLLLAYLPVERQVQLPPGFDDSVYPEGLETVPRQLAIPRGNRMMVDRSTHLIAYCVRSGGNTAALVKYAEKRVKVICVRNEYTR